MINLNKEKEFFRPERKKKRRRELVLLTKIMVMIIINVESVDKGLVRIINIHHANVVEVKGTAHGHQILHQFCHDYESNLRRLNIRTIFEF